MAISLSNFSRHSLPQHHAHPKPSNFLYYSSKSSPYSIQSNLSLKPSSPKNPSHNPNLNSNKLLCESLVESMASLRDTDTYIPDCANLVKYLCSSGELDLAYRVISLLELDNTANIHVYNTFISGLFMNNQVIPALETLGRMRVNGCKPNIETRSILVSCLCRRGQLHLALEMVEHFKTHYKFHPDLFKSAKKFLLDLLKGTSLQKGVEEGMELLAEMKSEGSISHKTMYSSFVWAVCETGNVDKIQAVLDDISASHFPLSASAYCALVKALLENKHWGKVDKAINEMFVKHRMRRLNAVVKMLCEEGWIDEARVLLERLITDKRYINYPVMHTFLTKVDHPSKAVDFINFIISIDGFFDISFYNMPPSNCWSPNNITYALFIEILWNIGDHVGSVKLVSQLLERGLSPDEFTYTALITCLCKDGMVDEAMEIMRIMVGNGLKVTVQIYDAVLEGLCKVGRVNEAIDLLEEMLESGYEVNRKSLGKTIGIVLVGVAHLGYESEATKIAEELVLGKFISPVDLLNSFK